jgi:hypothetical protein
MMLRNHSGNNEQHNTFWSNCYNVFAYGNVYDVGGYNYVASKQILL